MERRLAAVMLLDVVGYSRLMEIDEAGTLKALKHLRLELIEPRIGHYKGRIVKLLGDGALVEFASVIHAVDCAIDLQRSFGERNDVMPSAQRIDFRIGVNLGDVFVVDGDLYGDGVNIAARLEGLADPGGICISGTAFDHVKSKADVSFEFLGENQVKNIEEPVRVYKVGLDGANALKAASFSRARATRRRPTSIAIIPFHSYSKDADFPDFVAAFCEDLEIAFSQLHTLQVFACDLTMAALSRDLSHSEIRARFGIDYLVQGSIRSLSNRIRVNIHVIHLETGFNVWAEHFSCSLDDFESGAPSLIERMVASAQTQIVLHVGANNKQLNDAQDHVEHQASKAWSMIYRLTPEAMDEAEKLATAALSLDPHSARAHQVLACALYHKFYMGFAEHAAAVLDPALEHINRAVELNEDDEYSHWVRGNVHVCLRNTDSAIAAFGRCREINPSFSLAIASHGTACAWSGRRDEAVRLSEQALAANPKDPSNFFRFNTISVAHFTAGDYENALHWAERTTERRKKFLVPHLIQVASSALVHGNDVEAKVREMLNEFPAALTRNTEYAPFTRTEDREALEEGLKRAFEMISG
ncbi:adenylate/guanylate cyclase domain-containing protein [Roseibium sp.]|uniref:adenylate/guanylate cyclase domain-containing protein n=1 Tax=Roseibium sp. TaxID=1936156 RepID=UPI003D0DDBB1